MSSLNSHMNAVSKMYTCWVPVNTCFPITVCCQWCRPAVYAVLDQTVILSSPGGFCLKVTMEIACCFTSALFLHLFTILSVTTICTLSDHSYIPAQCCYRHIDPTCFVFLFCLKAVHCHKAVVLWLSLSATQYSNTVRLKQVITSPPFCLTVFSE